MPPDPNALDVSELMAQAICKLRQLPEVYRRQAFRHLASEYCPCCGRNAGQCTGSTPTNCAPREHP